MIAFSNKYRSSQEEIMDDFQLQGAELSILLSDLKRVNRLLGGNKVTQKGLDRLMGQLLLKTSPIKLLDLGCGDGEMLRTCGRYLEERGMQVELIGIDANDNILSYAKSRSSTINNITFIEMNVFSSEKALPSFDIALCTLFLHHFECEKIVSLLNELNDKAQIGVIVNDLHRSAWAFNLFKIFSKVFLKTKIARHDGLVSVARGFKKDDLERYSEKIKGHHSINWKWAFRYLWVISK